MIVTGLALVDDFKAKHASSRASLDRWIKIINGAKFEKPNDIKALFGSRVDFVGEQIVFDVGGNKIRAITLMQYEVKIILITHVLTHKEYDKGKWRIAK